MALVTWFGRLTTSYDARSAISGFADPAGGLATTTYDQAGRKVSRLLPDGGGATLSYDGASRLIAIQNRDAAGATVDQALLTFDAAGNPVVKVTQDGPHTMSYDSANQLLSEDHPLAGVKTWTFDPACNRLSQDHTQAGVRTLTNWAYNPADELMTETTGAAVTSFSFDQAGNQRVVQEPAAVTTQSWDQENRLVRIDLPSGAVNTMQYRPDGLRSRLSDSEADKRMVWDSLGSSGYVDLLEENF